MTRRDQTETGITQRTRLREDVWVDSDGNVVDQTGRIVISAATQALVSGAWILNGATAGQDSGWLPLVGGQFRLAYALDSGTTSTTFSVDISADGVTSLAQAFTGTWASSTVYEDTQVRQVSNREVRFIRFNVLTGGPLSVRRIF